MKSVLSTIFIVSFSFVAEGLNACNDFESVQNYIGGKEGISIYKQTKFVCYLNEEGERQYIVNLRSTTKKETELIYQISAHDDVVKGKPIDSFSKVEFSNVNMDLMDLTGNGNMEIVYQSNDLAEFDRQIYLAVYDNKKSSIKKILSTISSEGLEFSDLGKDGSVEIITYKTEYEDLHLYDLSWPVIYEWNGSIFINSGFKYKKIFLDTLSYLRQSLKDIKKEDFNDSEVIRHVTIINAYISRIEKGLFLKKID